MANADGGGLVGGQSNSSRRKPHGTLLSLVREIRSVVLLRHLLLPHILPVLRRVPLFKEGGEPHCVITGLDSLNSTIQSSVAGEEIRVGALYWIERCT